MSNKFCPNLSLPESKALIEEKGLVGFYIDYIENNYKIPGIVEDITDLPKTRSVEDIVFVNKELFDAYQQNDIINSFVYQIYDRTSRGDTNPHASFLADLAQTVRLFEGFPETVKIFQDVIDNYNEFYKRAEQTLANKGVKRVALLNTEDNVEYSYEDTEYDYQGALFQKLNYSDEANFIQSSKDTASSHIKLALTFIPKYEIENGKVVTEVIDGKEEFVVARNYLGLEQYEDMDVIWNDLLYTLIDEPIGRKLDYLANSSNPKHRIIAQHIKSNPNTEIQNEFESTFSKQQAKFITALVERPDGKGFKTITVLDTNRNNANNLVINDWYNNFLLSDFVKTDDNGDKYIDTVKGKELKQEFLEALKSYKDDTIRGSKDLKKIFNKVGINISLEALQLKGLEEGRSTPLAVETIMTANVKFIFDRLAGEIDKGVNQEEDTLMANNPFIEEDKALNLLASLENTVNPSTFESSFIRGDGTASYSFVNNSFLSHRMRSLTGDKTFAENLKGTAYAGGSHYLEQLTGPNRDNFLHNFSLHYVDSLGNNANNQTNKTFNRMNTKEKEFFRVSLFQNGNKNTSYFIGLTPSDKTTLPLLKVPKINIGNYSAANKVNRATKAILLKQFVSEYERVKRTIEQNSDPNVRKLTGYHGDMGMGTRFLVFPWANKLFFSEGKLLPLGTTEVEQLAWPHMEAFINEIVQDQVNYWHELGLATDNMIFDKSYGAKTNYNLTDLAANYAINNLVFLHNQTQIISGDPALHAKLTKQDREKGIITNEGSVTQTWVNYYKRLAKDIAPGLDGNFGDKASFKTIFLKDLEYTSNHLNEYLEKVGGHLSKAYGEINPADAQEYTTLDEHLKVMRAYGRLTREHEEAVKRLKKGGSNINDINLILQPMKPVYVASKIENGIEVFYYIKTSSFPLIPALTEGLEIDKLRRAMEDPVTGVDRAVYESGVKLGLQGSLTEISKDGGTTFNDISFTKDQIVSLDRSGFRIQQELPYHGMTGNTNEGSQGRKLVLSNVIDSNPYTFNGKQYTGRELKDIYEQLHIEKMDRAWDQLLSEIGFNIETGRIEDISALAKILQEEANTRDYPINDIYSIQLINDGGIRRFQVPLAFTNNSTRFESILNSLVTNRVIKSELPGFTLVQAASTGFSKQPQFVSDERLLDYKGVITWVNPKETELGYIKEEDGRLVSADIIVPNYFQGVNLKDYIVGGYLATDLIPEELLTIIGLRIPTQGKNSMMKFRVKGFLPDIMGELAIVPAEITAQMGSDFDVDKLFLYRYNYRKANNDKLIKIQSALPDNATDIDYRKLSSEQIDNLIIQMFEDVLSDPSFYNEIIEPNGFGQLPTAAENVRKAIIKNNLSTTLTSRAQNNLYESNADGKMGTAIFSLYSTFFRSAQDADLNIGIPMNFKDDRGDIKTLSSLGGIYNIENNTKSNTIMYLQSAAVDNAKDPVLGDLNINEYTMNEAGVLAMLGLPEDFIGYFMSQPVIREYVNRISQNGDMLGGEFVKNINEIVHQELFNMYKGDLDRALVLKLLPNVSYSKKDLLDNLTNGGPTNLPSTLTPEEATLQENLGKLLQLKVLQDFANIRDIANEVKELQRALSVDTKGIGINMISVIDKSNKFNDIMHKAMNNMYSIHNVQALFKDTAAGRAQTILRESRQLFSRIFPYSTPIYSSTINSIYESSGLNENETNLKSIIGDIKSYILSSEEFIGENVNEARERILYGDNNIAKRWIDYSKTDKGLSNPLTKRIKGRTARKEGDLNYLNAINTPASNHKQDIDNSIMFFFDMLNSSDSVERHLAEDMVKYHLLTGAQYNASSIGKYITYDVLERNNFSKKLRDINTSLYTSNIDFNNFKDQYFTNNPFKAHSVKLTRDNLTKGVEQSPDQITLNRLGSNLILHTGRAAEYIVNYNESRREPRVYKLVGTGPQDSLVYKRIPVNPNNKVIKNYNFEERSNAVANHVPIMEQIPTTTEFVEEVQDGTDRIQAISDGYSLEESPREVLESIIRKTNSDYKKGIAGDLLNSLESMSALNIEISSDRAEANGWYDSSNNTIYINLANISQFANPNAKLEEVILHEMLHAATVNLLDADDSILTAKQRTARNKIKRLFNEYSSTVDQDVLKRYRDVYNKEKRTEEETNFLVANKQTYYPLLNEKEFVAAGLTSESFRNTLQSNNLWQRFLDLVSNLLGINASDLDILYTSTVDLINNNISERISNQNNNNIVEDLSELSEDQINQREFVKQRDEFFRAYKVKDYFNNFNKTYNKDTQERFLGANNNSKYNRLRVWFYYDQLRVSRVDPSNIVSSINLDISEDSVSSEDKLINRLIKTYEGRLKTLVNRQRSLGERSDVILDRDIQRTQDKLNQLKNDRSMMNVYETSSEKMNEIEESLNSDTISKENLDDFSAYLNEFLIVTEQVDFDTTDEEGIGLNYNKRFHELAGRARDLKKLFNSRAIELIEKDTNTLIPKADGSAYNFDDINLGLKDVNVLESQFLDYSSSTSQHIRNIGYLIERGQYNANEAYVERIDALEPLLQEYIKKYGKDFSQLLQTDKSGKVTGYLLNKYQDEYYKKTKGKRGAKFLRENAQATIPEENIEIFEDERKVAADLYKNNVAEYNTWLQNNDPNIWVNNFNSKGIFDRDSPALRFVKIVPSDNWIDTKYQKLIDKGENDPAVKLYRHIEPIFRQSNRKRNMQVNYIPEIELGAKEYMIRGKFKAAAMKLWEDWARLDSDSYKDSRDNDDKIKEIDINNITNEPRQFIPSKMFGNKLEISAKSFDLAQITSAVIHQEETIKAKQDMEPLLNIYYALLKDSKTVTKYNGQETIVNAPPKRMVEQSRYLIDHWLYNQTRDKGDLEAKMGGATDQLIAYTRLAGMGWNPFSAIGNLTQSLTSNYIFARGNNQYFSERDYFRSLGENLHQIAGSASKANKIKNAFRFTDALVLTNELNFGRDRKLKELERFRQASWMEPFFMTERVEYFNQGQTMVAVLMSIKVKNLKGETKSLWDAYDDNFKWKTEEFGEEQYKNGSTEKYRLQSRVRKAIIDVHGNYARAIPAKRHFYARALMVFRTWLPQAIHNRFGGYRNDEFLDIESKGRYRSFGSFITNSDNKFDFAAMRQNLLWLLKLSGNTEMSKVDQMNMKKNLGELIFLIGIIGAIYLLRSFTDDDDENEVTVYILNSMMRAQSDLTMFLSFNSWDTVLKDPIPVMSLGRNLVDVGVAAIDHLQGNGTYQSGYRKGQSKIFKETVELFPPFSQPFKQWGYSQQLFSDMNR